MEVLRALFLFGKASCNFRVKGLIPLKGQAFTRDIFKGKVSFSLL